MKRQSLTARLLCSVGLAFLLLLTACLVGLFTGSVPVSFNDMLRVLTHSPTNESLQIILWDLRLPRVILGGLVGCSLALAGTAYQGILRNPLADPYIVGTSAGASVGATLAIICHIPAPCSWLSPVPFFSFLGALAAMLLVFKLSYRHGALPVTTFLLAGVVVGSFAGALVSFMMTLAGQDLQRVVLWLMGSLSQADNTTVTLMLPYTLLGSFILLGLANQLNIASMGDDTAQSLGVNVERLKLAVITAGSLLTAAAVAASGLIGFLGLVIPHITRLIVGPDNRILLPVAALTGAAFLILMDSAAATLASPHELPVGVLTALVGAPFFFWLLYKKRGQY